MRDYWLSQFLFDMQDLALRARFRVDPDKVLQSYPLAAEARQAVLGADLQQLAQRVNPYLLRYYFGYIGMPEEEFLRRVRQLSDVPGGAPRG